MPPAYILVLVLILWTATVSSRMCYKCFGTECINSPGKPVDCGNGECCLDINLSGDNPGSVRERSCKKTHKEKEDDRFSCFTSASHAGSLEHCYCSSNLCNGKDPQDICSGRYMEDEQVRALFKNTGKCENEVRKGEEAQRLDDEELERMEKEQEEYLNEWNV